MAGRVIRGIWNQPSVVLRGETRQQGPTLPTHDRHHFCGLAGNTESWLGWHYPFCTHRGWDRNFGVVNQSREDLWGTEKRGGEREEQICPGNWVGALITVGAVFGCVGGFFSIFVASMHQHSCSVRHNPRAFTTIIADTELAVRVLAKGFQLGGYLKLVWNCVGD